MKRRRARLFLCFHSGLKWRESEDVLTCALVCRLSTMTVAAAVAAGAAVLLLSACLPVHAAGVKGTEVAPAVEHGGAAHDCFWTSPEGNHYDLTSLSHHVYQYPSSRVLSRCAPLSPLPVPRWAAVHNTIYRVFQVAGGV